MLPNKLQDGDTVKSTPKVRKLYGNRLIKGLRHFFDDFKGMEVINPDWNIHVARVRQFLDGLADDSELVAAMKDYHAGSEAFAHEYEQLAMYYVYRYMLDAVNDYDVLLKQFKRRLDEKVRLLEEDTYRLSDFSEFGLRRRLSAEAQEMAVKALAEVELPADSHFIGTSNVYLAKKFNLKPVGTMAHEWIMCTGQGNHKHNPAYSNWYALDAWVKEYGILNGIALTDTITTDCFLRDFQLTYATLFSGVRQDSGDPYEWGDKMIAHYNSLGINPRTKTLLFSDSLDFERATALYDYFKDKAKVAFGIGTFISNDTDEEALNIVMKTTKCNGMDVAKISDVAGKGMCKNPDYVDYLNRCIDYRMKNDK